MEAAVAWSSCGSSAWAWSGLRVAAAAAAAPTVDVRARVRARVCAFECRAYHEDDRLELGVRTLHPRQAQGEAVSVGTQRGLRAIAQPRAHGERRRGLG